MELIKRERAATLINSLAFECVAKHFFPFLNGYIAIHHKSHQFERHLYQNHPYDFLFFFRKIRHMKKEIKKKKYIPYAVLLLRYNFYDIVCLTNLRPRAKRGSCEPHDEVRYGCFQNFERVKTRTSNTYKL